MRVLRLSETLSLPSLELKQPLPLPHSLLCLYSEHETLSREEWSINDVAQVNCRSLCVHLFIFFKKENRYSLNGSGDDPLCFILYIITYLQLPPSLISFLPYSPHLLLLLFSHPALLICMSSPCHQLGPCLCPTRRGLF